MNHSELNPPPAVEIIRQQKAEIDRLTARVAEQEQCIAVNVREYLKLEEEHDRLRAALETLKAELPDSRQIIQAVLDGMTLRPADETTVGPCAAINPKSGAQCTRESGHPGAHQRGLGSWREPQ